MGLLSFVLRGKYNSTLCLLPILLFEVVSLLSGAPVLFFM